MSDDAKRVEKFCDGNVNYPDNLDWMSQRGRSATTPAVGEVTFADARPFDPGLCVALGETVTRETIRTIGSAIAAARAEERKECWHKEFETRGIIAEAVRKEERERVWRKAHESIMPIPRGIIGHSDEDGDLSYAYCEGVSYARRIANAALADGVDLTSLADEK